MRIEQHRRVFGEPTRKRMASDRLWYHRLGCRQAPRVLLDALDAEELFANGLPAIPRWRPVRASEGSAEESRQLDLVA
jgi:hypothetical protein